MNPEDWLIILGVPSIIMVFGSMIYYVRAQQKMRLYAASGATKEKP